MRKYLYSFSREEAQAFGRLFRLAQEEPALWTALYDIDLDVFPVYYEAVACALYGVVEFYRGEEFVAAFPASKVFVDANVLGEAPTSVVVHDRKMSIDEFCKLFGWSASQGEPR